MMTSLLEYLDKDWEMTVFPQPKAPGMAVVPPCTHLRTEKRGGYRKTFCWLGKAFLTCLWGCETHGKRASSTLCPVSSGWLAGSFSVTGRTCLTGHTCTMVNLSFTPSNSSSITTSWHRDTRTASTQSSYFTAVAGGVADSRWRRTVRAEPRRSRCLCFSEAAWSCDWWGSFRTLCHRCLLPWCDCQPNSDLKKRVNSLMVWTYQLKVWSHIPAGSCWD